MLPSAAERFIRPRFSCSSEVPPLTIDPGIALLSAFVGALIVGTVAYSIIRNRIPPDVAALLAEAVARLRAHLSYADTEAMIRLYAGELYDAMAIDSAKVSREFFVSFCVRAILGAQLKGAEDAETFGALAVER